MPPVHWAAGAKLPGGINPLPYNNLHRYRARPILAGLRAPRFPVGAVRENAGGHVGQQRELRKLGAGVGQPQTVGRQRTDLLCDGVKPA